MSAAPSIWIPHRSLLALVCPKCGKPRRRRGWLDRARKWAKSAFDPLAAYASGDVMLDPSGNRILTNTGDILLDDGAGCTSCCGGGGGGTWGCNCAGGFTFNTITVTFSGLSWISGCFSVGGGEYGEWTGHDLSTYTFTPTSNTCPAMGNTDSGPFFKLYSSSSCASLVTTGASCNISLQGNWQVTAQIIGWGNVFNGAHVTNACSGGIVLDNSYTTTPIYGGNIASGGTATITFS